MVALVGFAKAKLAVPAVQTVLFRSPEWVRAAPNAQKSLALVNDLVPPELRADPIYHILGKPLDDPKFIGFDANTRAVLGVFTDLKSTVERQAASYGLKVDGTSAGLGKEQSGTTPDQLVRALRAVIGKKSVGRILDDAAKKTAPFQPELARALTESAKTFRGLYDEKGAVADSRLRAALNLKEVEYPQLPKLPQPTAQELAARSSTYEQNLQTRASKAFDTAGYAGPEWNGKKAFYLDPPGTKRPWDYQPLIYLTREEFIAREVPKLREADKRPVNSGGFF